MVRLTFSPLLTLYALYMWWSMYSSNYFIMNKWEYSSVSENCPKYSSPFSLFPFSLCYFSLGISCTCHFDQLFPDLLHSIFGTYISTFNLEHANYIYIYSQTKAIRDITVAFYKSYDIKESRFSKANRVKVHLLKYWVCKEFVPNWMSKESKYL